MTGVDELVLCINIALSASELAACTSCDPNNDGVVVIGELLQAVARATGDCRPDFAEAVPGVAKSVVDAVDALRVLNFGFVGPSGALRVDNHSAGRGAGTVSCIQCAQEAALVEYGCVAEGENARLIAVLDGCSDGITVRSGRLELEIQDPTFCTACSIGPGTVGVQSLTSYTEASNGRTLQVPQTITEAFQITGDGCPVSEGPDKSSRFNGTLRAVGQSTDVSFSYDDLTIAITSQPLDGDRCRVTTRQTGIVSVDDAANNRRFLHASENLILTEADLRDGGREVSLNTPAGGSLNVDCLGGPVRLATPEDAPFLFPNDSPCASSGELQITFLETGATSAIRASDGGLQFDLDFDGTFTTDEEVSSCADPSISQCRVPLPAIVVPTPVPPSPTITPTVTPPPSETSTSTPSVTPSETATSSATPTSTSTPSETPTVTPSDTPTFTSTATDTPTETATPTPTPLLCRTRVATATGTPGSECGRVVPAGLIAGETWTQEESPYCVTGNIQVARLSIECGVEVLVDGAYEIEVLSTITAAGTSETPIRFAAKDPSTPWRGFRFENAQPGSAFSGCMIEDSSRSAVTLVNSAAPTFRGCVFRANRNAENGGAIDANGVNGDLHVEDCQFIGNEADRNGGALRVKINGSGRLLIQRSLFDGNVANPSFNNGDYVGGALWLESGNSTVSKSTFSNNWANARASCFACPWFAATARGGAVYISVGDVAFENTAFVSNQTDAGASGCCFPDSVSRGGAMFQAGGSLRIQNSAFACNRTLNSGGNPTSEGAGIYLAGGSCTVENTTIARNVDGSGVARGAGGLQIQNSIAYFNAREQIQGDASVTFSDVQFDQGVLPGEGNINSNPVFAGPGCTLHELRIVDGSGSLAIDSGNPAPEYDDVCFPPSEGTLRNDMGAFGGPGACNFQLDE